MSTTSSAMEDTSNPLILCCNCGAAITPNAANMCLQCIRSSIDITEGIPHQSQLYWCKFCDRYLQPPDTWVTAPLESRELLGICMKKLRGPMSRVRLVDAAFVWTEPHSRRVKIKLTVQKEIMGGAVLQQDVVVEFTVYGQMCETCTRAEANDYWRACVQVRQRCDSRKTMFYMEQLVLKAGLHKPTTGVTPMPTGIDFFFARQQDARRLVDYIMSQLPARQHYAQELVTHDAKNNIFDYKHTWCVELVPICKDNIVCLPRKLSIQLGNMSQICLVSHVTSSIHLIDPRTAQTAEVNATQYWRFPFDAISQTRHLTEYTVIDSELLDHATTNASHGRMSNKHRVADLVCMRSSELGRTNAQEYIIRTHVGHLLNAGDLVMGFDLSNANVNNEVFDAIHDDDRPDMIVVRKVYDRRQRVRRRNWKLQRLTEKKGGRNLMQQDDAEFDEFLEDLEEEPAIRQGVNIYNAPRDPAASTIGEEEEGLPTISLNEMLDEMTMADDEEEMEVAQGKHSED